MRARSPKEVHKCHDRSHPPNQSFDQYKEREENSYTNKGMGNGTDGEKIRGEIRGPKNVTFSRIREEVGLVELYP